jgi:hypothetical protein
MKGSLARPVLDQAKFAGGPCFLQLGLGGIQPFDITRVMDVMVQAHCLFVNVRF